MCFRVKKTANSKTSKPCLKLMLHHGDVMIMHGADIQRVYEVSLTIKT
jgi:alkylated DNA repair dioxygenase AlkB